MSEVIQEGPGPKPKRKRKKIKRIKIVVKPSNKVNNSEFNSNIYFDCEQEVNSEDVTLVKSISVEDTAIINAQEFHFDPDFTDSFYMLDDDEGSIRASLAALDEGQLLSLTITYHDELPPEPTYEVSFEM